MKARRRPGPPLARLATSTADISRYAPLRYRPVHENAEGWVAAGPDDVAAALSSAALTVAPAGEPSGAARLLQAQMARFSDGAAHQRRRALVQALLPDPAGLERDAWSMTSARLAGRRGRWDAMELARRVPCAVLAAALGVAPEAADAVARLTVQLCAVLAPRTGTTLVSGEVSAGDGDAAATALLAALAGPGLPASPGGSGGPGGSGEPGRSGGPGESGEPGRSGGSGRSGGPGESGRPSKAGELAGTAGEHGLAGVRRDERAVAAASILFQARDATAGLIGLALSAAAGHPQATAADLIGLAERADPPVQCTRRVAAGPVTIGGVSIPAGALVWVLLATADRGDPWPPATFGGGPHACPGRPAATALARGVVGAVLGGGWRPVPGQAPGYEPRPNLRIPVSVLLERS